MDGRFVGSEGTAEAAGEREPVIARALRPRPNGAVHTFARLCTSRHVNDLRWIAIFVIAGWILGLVCLYYEQRYLRTSNSMSGFTITLGGLAAGAGAALNWAYQTGSNRLGMIDLFACEISVVCRVCLVVDFARRSVDRAKNESSSPSGADTGLGRHQPPARFASQEEYTPVYDQNLSQLQPLDAQVVTHVTEFYTYRKTMMDMLRRIAVQSDDRDGEAQSTAEMIYMQFLMYESGRLSLDELIDYEPNRTESVIGILCSELVVYKFLVDEFSQDKYRLSDDTEDFRLRRLNLRRSGYENKVQEIYAKTAAQHSTKWKKAQTTVDELKERFSQLEGTSQRRASRLHSKPAYLPIKSKTRQAESIYCFTCQSKKRMEVAGVSGSLITQADENGRRQIGLDGLEYAECEATGVGGRTAGRSSRQNSDG